MMYVGHQHIFTLNHNGGTVDYSNGGYSGVMYFGCPNNDTDVWRCLCNPNGRSDSWILLDLIPLSKKVGAEFLGWYWNNGQELRLFDENGRITVSGNLKSLGVEYCYQVSAKWRLISVPITADHSGGSSSLSLVYYNVDNGGYYTDASSTQGIASMPIPTKAGYRFLGYYSEDSGGTKYVDADGTFTAALRPTSAITMYAQWTQVSRVISLDMGGGSGGTSTIYYRISGGGIYFDELCTNAATSITTPSKTNARFVGYYSAESGGTKYIDEAGVILPALSGIVLAADTTIYAQWVNLYTISFDKVGGSEGSSGLWYDSSTGLYYSDSGFRTPTTSITAPTRAGNTFIGYFSAASGGTKYIEADGTFTSAMPTPTENLTFYAQWQLKAYVLYLDAAGGERAPSLIYYKPGNGWSLDEAGTQIVTAIDTPLRSGYTYGGYYDENENIIIGLDGTIALVSISDDVNATASWTAQSFTLTFDYRGGTSGILFKTVTMGQPVGELPTSAKTSYVFAGWRVAGIEITAETIWNVAANSTAVAEWAGYVGYIHDWFGLGSNDLIPIESDAGDNRKRICVSHIGKYEPGVNATSGTWRNPSVTYQVVHDITFAAVLGLAFPGNGMISGYMIVGIEVNTKIGEFPTVTVSAVANEGVNAINTFPVSIPIEASAHAQALLAAVSGGGHLQDLTLTAKCDPVVIAENMFPIASDVVNGKMTVRATMFAPRNEAAPVAGGGFVEVGAPKHGLECSCISYSINVEKEL